jgi:indole-3-glycerol phosphate synthase/phosphoribosylanthranilate isomerase
MLGGAELAEFHAEARELGLSALVECHDEDDIAKALAAGAGIVGINNRNLATLTTDLGRTPRLLKAIPDGVIRVCESGISRRAQIREFAALGADAFLVGHALLQAADPGRKLRQLLGAESETGRRIKVCGLTRVDDARLAHELGADLLGLIFAESPRRVDQDRALEIRKALPRARLCGVFVDEDIETTARLAADCDLDLLQLHGDESPAHCRQLRRRAGLPLIKALRVDQVAAGTVAEYDAVAAFLVDLPKPGNGSGVDAVFDPALLVAADILTAAGGEVLLAGGLEPGHLAPMLVRRNLGLDVCRGVEATPGRKDPRRLQNFLTEVAS